jgi:O-antigen ligase
LFFAVIVLLPFRIRFLVLERPFDGIWEDYTNFLLFASDITLVLLLASWAGSWFSLRQPITTGPAFITWPLAGLTLVVFATSIISIDPALSLYHSVRLLALFGFYLYVVNEGSSLRQLFAPLGLMLAIQAVVAIAQALGQHSVGLPWLGEYELDPAWSGVSVVWTETVRSLRAYGLTDHPNILGGCLAFGLLLFSQVHLANKPGNWSAISTGIILAAAVALLYTFSRSAWLGAALGFAFLGFHLFKHGDATTKRRALYLAGAIALVLLPFAVANSELLGVRLGANASFQELPAEIGSLQERAVLIKSANTIFSQHALVGIGAGASPLALKQELPNVGINYQPPHVVLLAAAVETGIIGALFYTILLVAPWLAVFFTRNLKMTHDLATAFALLLALTVVGLFDYYPWLLAPGRLWQYLAWGLWARIYVDASTKVKA